MNSIDYKKKRQFFLIMSVALFSMAVWKVSQHRLTAAIMFFTLSAVLVLIEFAANKISEHIFQAWMTFATILGYINTRVIISVIFFILITPIGISLRLLGKTNSACTSECRKRKSSWVKIHHSKEPHSYENAF